LWIFHPIGRMVGWIVPPYNDCLCYMLKIGFAKVSGSLKTLSKNAFCVMSNIFFSFLEPLKTE
ncbi:MAG: hypothetical protein IIU35_05900, partial [Neisseriaceae bacterium]|nr:hypothetical protein [Neisseriaceae bacterium]